MMADTFIDVLPLWLLYLVVATIVVLSIELGWRLGNHQRQRHAEEGKAPVSAPVGATIGLLAFLLAFTFGMAATRYDSRKAVVLQEANAIGTTYLRTDFLPDVLRNEARTALREYLKSRTGGAAAIMSPEGMAQSAALHDQLWSIATHAETISDTVSVGLFVQSLNDVIDLDTIRVTANRNRIPGSIWLMLGRRHDFFDGGHGLRIRPDWRAELDCYASDDHRVHYRHHADCRSRSITSRIVASQPATLDRSTQQNRNACTLSRSTEGSTPTRRRSRAEASH